MGFFSKILNSFKSIRVNEKNKVNDYLLDHLLIGSMYAEQQSAYLNSYATGLSKSDITKLVDLAASEAIRAEDSRSNNSSNF